MSVLSIAVFGIVAIGLRIPWGPIAALVCIPLLIGGPVELARHSDYLDTQISPHSNRDPNETGETPD
ncbi:hypothetical protein KTS45_11750 [Halomicroarcula limicola]|uniref:Uncharacterized protein n=1 Tax=Haloarcula limicola TaxID=1429915 RepID=A0A8J7Y5X8_9EURY|nr:hypothetical protein [Halomicroarcula limicola]MBV0924872.1 hypothetical protein [Halomicroarcula limicola]